MEKCNEINILRQKLEEEIDKNESLTTKRILALSRKLDKLINEYYRENK